MALVDRRTGRFETEVIRSLQINDGPTAVELLPPDRERTVTVAGARRLGTGDASSTCAAGTMPWR